MMQKSFTKLMKRHWIYVFSNNLHTLFQLQVPARSKDVWGRCLAAPFANSHLMDMIVGQNRHLQPGHGTSFFFNGIAKLSSDSISRDGQIHLIDEHGKSNGLMSFNNAKQLADEKELELYLARPVSHQSPHAIYKMLSKKDIFAIKKTKGKKSREQEKKQKIKEISFSTDIGEQDFLWKINRMKDFLLENDKIKLIINQKRRSKNQCKDMLTVVLKELQGLGEMEGNVVEMEKRVKCTLKPVKN